jgi:hypothetical protein
MTSGSESLNEKYSIHNTHTQSEDVIMRNYIAIALIVCGTLLALAPILSDCIQGLEIAKALSGRWPIYPSGFYRQPLEESYRIATWLLGGSMIGLGFTSGWLSAKSGQVVSTMS